MYREIVHVFFATVAKWPDKSSTSYLEFESDIENS